MRGRGYSLLGAVSMRLQNTPAARGWEAGRAIKARQARCPGIGVPAWHVAARGANSTHKAIHTRGGAGAAPAATLPPC